MKLTQEDKDILIVVFWHGINILEDKQARRYMELENKYGLDKINKMKRKLIKVV